MYLLIQSAQRDREVLALFDKNFLEERDYQFPTLLEAIDTFLQEKSLSKDDIQGIAVVQSEGTFSGTRIATTLTNAWHFVSKIPVVGVWVEESKNIDEMIAKLNEEGESYILPHYSGAPNIRLKK